MQTAALGGRSAGHGLLLPHRSLGLPQLWGGLQVHSVYKVCVAHPPGWHIPSSRCWSAWWRQVWATGEAGEEVGVGEVGFRARVVRAEVVKAGVKAEAAPCNTGLLWLTVATQSASDSRCSSLPWIYWGTSCSPAPGTNSTCSGTSQYDDVIT